jgi:hypothetical protein
MGADLDLSPFHRRLLGGLSGLDGLPLANLEPGALLLALAVIGDAIRLGLEVPSPVRRAAEVLSDDALRAAFRALIDETKTWLLPVEPDRADDLVDYAWAVRRRDEAESVLTAARRILVPRGTLPDELEEFRAFDAVLLLLDFTCGGRLGRVDAERALGERVIFATPGSWVEALPDLDEPETASAQGEARFEEVEKAISEGLPFAVPSDGAVDTYITRGRLAASIEGAAQRSPDFAEELSAMIDASSAGGATLLSLRARQWRRDRAGRGRTKADRAPVRIDSIPRMALAAADRDEAPASPKQLVPLGMLAPLDVEASLTISAETTTLRVYPARGFDLARVQLGPAVSDAADAEGTWRVDIPTTTQAIELRIEALDGSVFAEIIELRPEE